MPGPNPFLTRCMDCSNCAETRLIRNRTYYLFDVNCTVSSQSNTNLICISIKILKSTWSAYLINCVKSFRCYQYVHAMEPKPFDDKSIYFACICKCKRFILHIYSKINSKNAYVNIIIYLHAGWRYIHRFRILF